MFRTTFQEGSTNNQQATGTGLFGNSSASSQQTSLFGQLSQPQQVQTSQQAPGNGLFGNSSASSQQTSLFGQSTQPQQLQPPQGGLFGSIQNNQRTPQQGLFFQPQPQSNYEYRISNLEKLVSSLSKELELQNQKTLLIEQKLTKLNAVCGSAMKGLCSSGHNLTYMSPQTIQLGNFHCDVCQKSLKNSFQGSYRCSTCDFDRCEQCYLNSRII